MTDFETNQIIAIYLSFAVGSGGKRRPVLIIQESQSEIIVLAITSQYQNKSDKIKRQYFAISDWKAIGLSKPSWIDIRSARPIKKPLSSFLPIGKLSDKDAEALAQFIKDYRK